MTTSQPSATKDAITVLTMQHARIREMLDVVQASHGSARSNAFTAVRRLLAVHEAAEQQIVHPWARGQVINGDVVVDARLGEERDVKRAIAELEATDMDSVEFEDMFAALKSAIVAHAEREEREEFSQLQNDLDAGQLDRMALAVQLAETSATSDQIAEAFRDDA